MLTDIDKKNPEFSNDEITDVNIDGIERKKFRINGKGVLELDTSDINIIKRLKEVYPKLNELATQATSNVDISDDTPVEDQLNSMADVLQEIDDKMREYVDYIFDSNVSEICAANTSMYSPHGGKFTFEHITETLGKLYAENIDEEAKRISKRMKQHTDKYTGKRKR